MTIGDARLSPPDNREISNGPSDAHADWLGPPVGQPYSARSAADSRRSDLGCGPRSVMTSRAIIVTSAGWSWWPPAVDRRPGSCRLPVPGRETVPQTSGATPLSAIAQQHWSWGCAELGGGAGRHTGHGRATGPGSSGAPAS